MHIQIKNRNPRLFSGLSLYLFLLIIPGLLDAQHYPTYDRKPVMDPIETEKEWTTSNSSDFEIYPLQTEGELNIVIGDFVGQPVEIIIQDEQSKTVVHQYIDNVHVGYQWLDLNEYDLADGRYKVTVINNGNSFNAETRLSRKK